METRSIAIDGPSGAGKSTLAKMIARELGFIYVDTGALYRAIGLFAVRGGAEPTDAGAVAALLPRIKLELRYDETGTQRVILNGADVSDEIRAPRISTAASDVSAHPPVRDFLLETQREMSRESDVVMDGRDIGTVVLPGAGLKIFLTAAPEIRAERRRLELLEKGIDAPFEDVLRDIVNRDRNDSTRDAAPLREADGAVRLDTSDLTLTESFARLRAIARERLGV